MSMLEDNGAAKSDPALVAAALRKISWRLLPFLFLLYIVSYLDRINVSFAALDMNRDLSFGDEVFGFGGGIFFIGYFMFGIPSNMLVEKLGPRRWIGVIMVIWGAISMSMAAVNSQMSFFVLRFLLGVAEAGFFPGIVLYLTYWYPARERGLAVARFMTAIPVAGIIGGAVSAQLLQMNGVMSLPGWKWLFIITGAPAVILGVVVMLWLIDHPKDAQWLSDQERNALNTQLSGESAELQAIQETDIPIKKLSTLSDRKIWHFALLYFCLALAMYGFQLWLPQILSQAGKLDSATTAFLSIVPAVFQGAGMIFFAYQSDKKQERRKYLAASAVLAAIALLSANAAQNNLPMLVLALGFTAFGIWGTVGPFWAMPTTYLDRGRAALGIALINSVGNLGGFAGPYLIGALKAGHNSFSLSMTLVSVSLFTAALLAMLIAPEGKKVVR